MKSIMMVFVIGVILLFYGAMHYYVYGKLLSLFPACRWPLIVTLCVLGGSIFAIIALSRGDSIHWLARPLAFVAFSWMGIVFLFFVLSVSVDALAKVAATLAWQDLRSLLTAPYRSLGVGLLAIATGVWGYVSAQHFSVLKNTLTSSRLSQPVRIVQISDLHLGLLSNASYLRRMVDAVNALQADIIVSTGDLVDMQMDHLDGIGELMSQLSARQGKFAVYGNHEAFAGLESSHAFFTCTGFTLLSNNGVSLPGLVNVLGIDDPAVARVTGQATPRVDDLLRPFANGLFTVLLKHQPTVESGAEAWADLQLSGHVHGGQIFPFGLITRLFYREPYGLSQLTSGHWLYVSRGTGTWGPPMRVLAPAEISVFDLEPVSLHPGDGEASPGSRVGR